MVADGDPGDAPADLLHDAAPSCPPTIGYRTGMSPVRRWSSEWQTPEAVNLDEGSSPVFGSSRSSSTISNGFPDVPEHRCSRLHAAPTLSGRIAGENEVWVPSSAARDLAVNRGRTSTGCRVRCGPGPGTGLIHAK